MLKEINQVIRKIGNVLNAVNIIVGLLIGIAHVYLPFTSAFGLILGILMAVSGSASIGISNYFTSNNALAKQDAAPLKSTRSSNFFLGFALPMLLLNTGGSFFGMYTGTLLLVPALSIPLTTPIMAGIVLFSTLFASGTLINSWLQTHYFWEKFKQPQAGAPQLIEPTAKPAVKDAATQTDLSFHPKFEAKFEGLSSNTSILMPRPTGKRGRSQSLPTNLLCSTPSP